MDIGNLNLDNIVFSAPLAGISNRPYRVLARRYGAAVTYSEMVSSEGLTRGQKKTIEMVRFTPEERPIGVQLFGANPETMGKAAAFVAGEFKPDLIDINFGCPVNKVVKKNGGAAVLKDMQLTAEIVRATVQGAGEIPVTVKIRSGWDEKNPVFVEAGRVVQANGAAVITLHARSRSAGYSGRADWRSIAELKKNVDIPVIGNGDIWTPEDAARMIEETNCDAVMIGRASFGNPFIFRQVGHYLETGDKLPEPTLQERFEMALEHAALMSDEYGEKRGVIKMRRYLGWLVKGLPEASQLRVKLFQVETLDDIRAIFDEYSGSKEFNIN